MKLVIDSKIPFIKGYAEQLGEVVYLPGAKISASDVRDADVLIIRTRTHCNRELLEGSRVKFIATATIGYDHIDTQYLAQAGIAWTNCPGCNASSVAQYVQNSLLLLAAHGCWDNSRSISSADVPLSEREWMRAADPQVFGQLTLGIVGVGHVGTQVYEMARRMGFGKILLCDPPRAEREGNASFVELDEIARRCDVISFHTPLICSPHSHPTFHMASTEFFNSLTRKPVIFNSSRGEVIDTSALKKALSNGQLCTAVIDTWEKEPQIDRELLSVVFLGTPHIAGYSADGKANGTRMSLQAVARFMNIDPAPFEQVTAPDLPDSYAYYPEGEAHHYNDLLRLYDPVRDSLALKAKPELFEYLRGNYPLRREKKQM